jgi:hypothetical protein
MKRLILLVLFFFSAMLVLVSCSNNTNVSLDPASVTIQPDSSRPLPSLQDMKMSVIQRVSDLIMQEMSAAF